MNDDQNGYICLINKEEQFSLWFEWKKIPLGWKQIGPKGSKEECLKYIKETWKDITPKSLRKNL